MAIANTHETLLAYTMMKNQLTLEMSQLQSQKSIAVVMTSEQNSLLSASKASIRDKYKHIYDNDDELQELYTNYTEIPDFEDEIDKIVAQITEETERLSNWETQIDNEITEKSTELQEINAYMESLKTTLSSNIQEDFNYGLNG